MTKISSARLFFLESQRLVEADRHPVVNGLWRVSQNGSKGKRVIYVTGPRVKASDLAFDLRWHHGHSVLCT